MIASSSLVSPFSPLHAKFLRILPRVERHARIFFRGTRCFHKKEDFIAETVDVAWAWFKKLAEEKGKDASTFPMALAFHAARYVKGGRRLCGSEGVRDVMSPLAQRRRSFVVQSLPASTCTSHEALYSRPHGQQHQDDWEQQLQDNRITAVPDQVAFRLDFRAWMRRRTARERRILKAMIRAERTKDIAKEFALSEGRISQMRRQFEECWRAFVGDEAILIRRQRKSRKKRVRA
jgi:hypothetical protein